MKTLRQIGNSWGIIIPKAILKLIKVSPVKDDVEIIVESEEIKIRKKQ